MSPAPSPKRVLPLLSGVVLRSQSDGRLAALAAEGSTAAFTVIFERYERELRAHATRVVRPSRVDDVLQQTMLSAWSSLLAGTQTEHLRSWLHRIVHNTALNTTVKRGYDDGELPQTLAAAALTEDLVQGRVSAGEALTAIAALPAAQRQALTLTAINGHSARDAAAEMGVSENGLRQLVYRARTTMRSAVSAITPLPLLLSAATHATAAPTTLTSAGTGAGTVAGSSIVAGLTGGGSTAVAVKAAAVLAIAAGGITTTTALHHHQHHPRSATVAPPATSPARATITTPTISPAHATRPTLAFPPAPQRSSSTRQAPQNHDAQHHQDASGTQNAEHNSGTNHQTTGHPTSSTEHQGNGLHGDRSDPAVTPSHGATGTATTSSLRRPQTPAQTSTTQLNANNTGIQTP